MSAEPIRPVVSRKTKITAICIIILIILVVIGGSLFLLNRILFGSDPKCYDGVKSATASLNLSEIGTITSSKVTDEGGYNDCSYPADSTILSGTDIGTKMNTRLKATGYMLDEADDTWKKGSYEVVIGLGEGDTQILVRGPGMMTR